MISGFILDIIGKHSGLYGDKPYEGMAEEMQNAFEKFYKFSQDAASKPSVPYGWQLVPKDPTPQMNANAKRDTLSNQSATKHMNNSTEIWDGD